MTLAYLHFILSSSEYSSYYPLFEVRCQTNPVKKTHLSPLTLYNILSSLEGCTSINMLPSSTWKEPFNLSCLFCFSLNVRINK